MSEAGAAGRFWDREIEAQSHVSWMETPIVRDYINESISPGDPSWPLDWFQRAFPGLRFDRALSIGCGSGALERDLIRRGLCDRVDAFDGSIASLALARQLAAAEGQSERIRYFAADFNSPVFPRSRYDAVFFHQSLHHVGKIERLLHAILRTLRPEGILYLDEYVGPSRTDWSDRRIRPQRAAYSRLAKEVRRSEKLPLPIQPDDPSEALRSGEIVEQLAIGFRNVEKRGYGGNLLSVLYPAIDWGKGGESLLRSLIEEEKEMLGRGEPSFHAIIVAKPRSGVGRFVAGLRYLAEPRPKRIAYEIRSRLGRLR
ncbi:MAG TPA: class I SAM-dependent methyltransferase [Thermoanaerobaculia bacterium]|nr:class I SAM-dependent methyltransferase [Thermoanaerobaculia bacterium]